jgi:hypothetical protein
MSARTVSVRLPDSSICLAVCFALLTLFIQEGVTYYVSVQTAAVVFLACVLLMAGLVVRLTLLVLAVYVLFALFLLVTAAVMPETVSQNSSNIAVTTIGVLSYVALILAMTCLRPVRVEWLLRFFRNSSTAIVVTIVALVAITDLGLIAGVTREYFILQNVDLIDNYASMDVLMPDLAERKARGVLPDTDLFYGEQSFLSLVIFVSVVSHVLSSRMIVYLRGGEVGSSSTQGMFGSSLPLLFSGMACMLYIQSFSSLFYAVILLIFVVSSLFLRVNAIRLTYAKLGVLLVLLAAMCWVVTDTAPYYWQRLTTFSDSLSAQQRFGVLLDFLPQDALIGLHSQDRLPPFGFHNGLIYVVAIAGIGGFGLIVYLLYFVSQHITSLGLVVLCVFALLAVFSQNGGIFSPNKVVLMSFLLVPITTAPRAGQRRFVDIYTIPVGAESPAGVHHS